MALTQVSSGGIKDGSITNADLDSSAAIDGSKVSPDFGNQNITTTGTVTGAALIPSGNTVPTDGIYLADTNTVALSTNGTEALRIDANGNILVATDSARAGVPSAVIQVDGTSATASRISVIRNSNDINNSAIVLGKSRGTTPGSNAILQSGDVIGNLIFAGADGVDLNSQAATIQGNVDGATGADIMPGRLVFSTNPGTFGASPQERLRITSAGLVGIGTSSPSETLHVNGTIRTQRSGVTSIYLNQYVDSNGVNLLAVNTSNANHLPVIFSSTNNATTVERMRIDAQGRVGIGTTAPQAVLNANGSGTVAAFTTSTGNPTTTSINLGSYFTGLSSGAFIRCDTNHFSTLASELYFTVNGTDEALRINSNKTTILKAAANQPPFIAKVNTSEVARIDSSGRLLVGTSSTTSSSKLVVSGAIDCGNLNPDGPVARNRANFTTSTTVDLPRSATYLITVRCQSGAFGTAPRSGLFMFTANAGTTSGIQAPVAVGGDTGAFSLSVANISTSEVQLTITVTDTGRIFGGYGIIKVI